MFILLAGHIIIVVELGMFWDAWFAFVQQSLSLTDWCACPQSGWWRHNSVSFYTGKWLKISTGWFEYLEGFLNSYMHWFWWFFSPNRDNIFGRTCIACGRIHQTAKSKASIEEAYFLCQPLYWVCCCNGFHCCSALLLPSIQVSCKQWFLWLYQYSKSTYSLFVISHFLSSSSCRVSRGDCWYGNVKILVSWDVLMICWHSNSSDTLFVISCGSLGYRQVAVGSVAGSHILSWWLVLIWSRMLVLFLHQLC